MGTPFSGLPSLSSLLRPLIAPICSDKPVLSEAMCERFQDLGVLVFDPEIPEQLIDQVRVDMDARSELSNTTLSACWQDGWRESRAIRSIARAPKVLRLLRQVYGRKPLPFQTLSRRFGPEMRIHSDSIHFATDPPHFMCGVWVALEEMDELNGTLVYYPHSHKLPVIRCEDFSPQPGRKYYEAYEDLVQTMIDRSGLAAKHATIRKGLAVVWAANLIHGGLPRFDWTRTRYSQVTHYTFEGCQYYHPLESYGGYRHLIHPTPIW